MAGILALGEIVAGRPTRLTLELATLATTLAAEAGLDASVLLVGADASAATEVAAHGATVLLADARLSGAPDAAGVAVVAATLIEQRSPDIVLVGATADGKDVAGALLGLTDLPILVAASRLSYQEGSVAVEASTFGGRLVTMSQFNEGRGIVIVRAGATPAETAAAPGAIEQISVGPQRTLPAVAVVDTVTEASAGPSIDDARVVVGAGRGVAGAEGIALLDELASALDGAVGATRAAVDSGWIDFGQQIGQTGKTVKPDLYIACGVSGAIQHKVGVQAAGTIVAINKDPDAPISDFADLLVVGDLFEIVPRLSRAIRAARENDEG